MAAMADALRFFAPGMPVIQFPGWDCLPYDRVSPSAAIAAKRIATLGRLARYRDAADDGAAGEPLVVLTTANALVQRLVKLGLLVEITGHARNRRYLYRPYIQLFTDL